MGLSQIKVLGASLHGYQSQVNQELQNLKGQAARHVLLIIMVIIILLLYISNSPDIEYFHSRGQHLCKFTGTKESVCIRKEFNSHRIGLGHQHGRRDVM